MQKFNTLKSIPAYLPIVNIDTDMIIPKQFLKTIKRTGLGKNLFFEMRYDDQGKEINDFVLNTDPYNNSKILIAGKNFGCGSSREHAPWALLDFGITCVISSSFADIFYNNCFKNGILPIILDDDKIKELSEYAKRKEEIFIDLKEEKVIFGNNELKFKVDSFKKKCLLEGLDDIALSLKKSDKIEIFEKDLKVKKNITSGIAYVYSTFNNTIISIADENGNVVSWSSAGAKGFKGSRKSTPYAAQVAADDAGAKAFEQGLRTLTVQVKGPGSGRETALRSLQSRGFKILSIKDTTPMPHNGARPPKRRRV